MNQQQQTDASKAGNTSSPQSSSSSGGWIRLLLILCTDITQQPPSQHQTRTQSSTDPLNWAVWWQILDGLAQNSISPTVLWRTTWWEEIWEGHTGTYMKAGYTSARPHGTFSDHILKVKERLESAYTALKSEFVVGLHECCISTLIFLPIWGILDLFFWAYAAVCI